MQRIQARRLAPSTSRRRLRRAPAGSPHNARCTKHQAVLLRGATTALPRGNDILHVIKGGSLRSPPAPAAGGRKRPSSPARGSTLHTTYRRRTSSLRQVLSPLAADADADTGPPAVAAVPRPAIRRAQLLLPQSGQRRFAAASRSLRHRSLGRAQPFASPGKVPRWPGDSF